MEGPRAPNLILLLAAAALGALPPGGRTAPAAGAAVGAAVGIVRTMDFIPADGFGPAPEQVEEGICVEPEGDRKPPPAGPIPTASPVEDLPPAPSSPEHPAGGRDTGGNQAEEGASDDLSWSVQRTLRQVNAHLSALAPRRAPEAYGRRRHTRAPGEPPGEDPFPGWPDHLLDGLLRGGAWFGMLMFGGPRWKGFPHWLQPERLESRR